MSSLKNSRIRDQSRQWPKLLSEIPNHHRVRYKYAANLCRGRTLDAACGVGYGSWLIGNRVNEVCGVDISPKAIGWAREYFPGPTYICGDIEKEPWEGDFETVVSLETIEHLKDPSRALQAFRRACKGALIASVPNEDKYPFKAENFVDDESPHFRHYTPKEFEDLLTENGFKVIVKACQPDKWHPFMEEGTDGMFLTYLCV